MQYGDIIVNHKAGYRPLSYSLEPKLLGHLGRGSVVLVPLGRAVVHGVVERFLKRLAAGLAPKIKPVRSIVYPEGFVPDSHLAAARLLHETYGLGLGETLFSLLPPFPRRRQAWLPKEEPMAKSQAITHDVQEWLIPPPQRPVFLGKLAREKARLGRSILILSPTARAAEVLGQLLARSGLRIALFPTQPSERNQREWFTRALELTRPTIFLGTRGALITPLQFCGAIVVDEPWLPGHKEERGPYLWTAIAAKALASRQNIPLYLVSTLPWPESQLLAPKTKTKTGPLLAPVRLTPPRPIEELLTHFLTEDDRPGRDRAIFIRPTGSLIAWCDKCAIEVVERDRCPRCQGEITLISEVSKPTLRAVLGKTLPRAKIALLSPDELLQYRVFDSALVIGFDGFLSIVDFRATAYLVTLISLIRSQAGEVLLVTSQPDVWTRLLQVTPETFPRTELALRRKHRLPPYSWPVYLTATRRGRFEKLEQLPPAAVLRQGPIREDRRGFRRALLLKPGTKIPSSWQTNRHLKVDLFPGYIASGS